MPLEKNDIELLKKWVDLMETPAKDGSRFRWCVRGAHMQTSTDGVAVIR
jgi:hypothetical protein